MHRDTVFFGALFILAGLVLLVGNVLQVSVWGLLWPLALVAMGLWVVWGAARGPQEEWKVEPVSIPLQGVDRAQVKLYFGAGRLVVAGGAGPDELLAGEFTGGVDYHLKGRGNAADLDLRLSGANFLLFVAPWNWWWARGVEWQVRLNEQVDLALEVESGASEQELDLSALQVHDLKLSTGASSLDLVLPAEAGFTQVEIEGGAASLCIRVPEGVAARIRTESGLASIEVDTGRFPRSGKLHQSPDYETAANKVDLKIEAGVSSVTIQ